MLIDKQEIESKLSVGANQVSNLDKCLDVALMYAGKLNALWDDGNYIQKQQLQFLVFPEGMYYNRKKDECRTERVNSVFLSIAQLASITGGEKNGNTGGSSNVAAWVASPRIELGSGASETHILSIVLRGHFN